MTRNLKSDEETLSSTPNHSSSRHDRDHEPISSTTLRVFLFMHKLDWTESDKLKAQQRLQSSHLIVRACVVTIHQTVNYYDQHYPRGAMMINSIVSQVRDIKTHLRDGKGIKQTDHSRLQTQLSFLYR